VFAPHSDRCRGDQLRCRRCGLAGCELRWRERADLDVREADRGLARNEAFGSQGRNKRIEVERAARVPWDPRRPPLPAPGGALVTLNPVLSTLIVVAIWFMIFVCLHIVGLRSRQGNAQWLVRSYASCCAATLVSIVALSMSRDSGQPLLLLLFVALLTSACLF